MRRFGQTVLATGLLVVTAGAAAQDRVRFSDIARTTGLIYPEGPTVTIDNPARVSTLELWVVRDLDAVIVQRRQVEPTRYPKATLRTKPPGSRDLLATLVQGLNAPLRFRVLLLDDQREVQDTRTFIVHLTAPDTTKTWTFVDQSVAPGSEVARVTAGKIDTIRGDEVHVTPWQSPTSLKFVFDKKTRISDAEGKSAGWTWPQAKEALKVGDQLGVVYTEKAGKKVASEAVIPLALSAGLPLASTDPFTTLHFQVGTVTSVKAGPPSSPSAMVMVTESPRRHWRISNNTRITRGATQAKRTDLTPRTLVAIGADDLKGDDVAAAYVMILTDLSGGPAH